MLAELVSKVLDSAIHGGRTSTPPIESPDGIASLEEIDLNGCRQWILVRGHDVSNPVLLFLHGGPGSAEMWLAHHFMRDLERHFVCVNWDQRGAGKSYRPGIPDATMTIGQFVDDAIALIDALRERFHRPKVLLVGQSWGSVLALKVAVARPDLVQVLVGMGQIVDMQRGETISYDYALDAARRAGNARAVRALRRIGPPPYRGDDLFVQRRWLSEFKGDLWSLDMPAFLSIGLRASEYSIGDVVRFFRGVRFSNRRLWGELMTVDFARDVPRLAVPVVFFAGRHDCTTPFQLVQSYFDALEAPSKRLVWFEQSAHMPNLEEPAKFQQELIAIGREFA